MKRLLIGMLFGLMLGLFALIPGSARAGERLLTVNNGSDNEVFFITGEQTLVMNGFDLTPISVLRPAYIDKVTIAVAEAAGGASQIVIYEDYNGGSPADAQLVHQQEVNIGRGGPVTITLSEQAEIYAPVVWVGFYLPVGFKFYADTSGSSPLTYWAWSPGGTFDLNNLASAGVLGPSNGSAPVNIDMGGKARITAEITPANPFAGTPVFLATFPTDGSEDAVLAELAGYEDCEGLFWDAADRAITYNYEVGLECSWVEVWQAPEVPVGWERRGELHNVHMYTDEGQVKPGQLQHFITHCVQPSAEEYPTAMVAVAYGVPEVWRVLPTQRFNNLSCAELPHGGTVAYFIPQG
jgi:hypothetical protein